MFASGISGFGVVKVKGRNLVPNPPARITAFIFLTFALNLKKMQIYTIGTANRSKEEFIRLLHSFGIEAVVDVRRFPTSKFAHFRREELEEMLREEGIAYFFCEALGGFRKGGYRKHMLSEEFQNALKSLEMLAEKRKVAILCAEKLYFRCHRRFIADALVQRGHEVIHIIDERRTQKHKLRVREEKTLDDFLI